MLEALTGCPECEGGARARVCGLIALGPLPVQLSVFQGHQQAPAISVLMLGDKQTSTATTIICRKTGGGSQLTELC